MTKTRRNKYIEKYQKPACQRLSARLPRLALSGKAAMAGRYHKSKEFSPFVLVVTACPEPIRSELAVE